MRLYLIYLFTLVMFSVIIVGCQETATPQPSPTATESASATPVDTPTVTPTPALDENIVTEEANSGLDPAPTLTITPVVTEEIIPFADGYSIAISQVQEFSGDTPSSMPSLGEGQKFVLFTVSLLNEEAADAITVERQDIMLLDTEGNTYEPIEQGTTISPLLQDITLETGDSFIGFALFSMPEDMTPDIFRWCLSDSCDVRIQTRFEILDR